MYGAGQACQELCQAVAEMGVYGANPDIVLPCESLAGSYRFWRQVDGLAIAIKTRCCLFFPLGPDRSALVVLATQGAI